MKKLILVLALTMLFTACNRGPVVVEKAPRPPAVLNCSEGMSEYAVTGTPIQFCYDPAWGTPVVAAETGSVGTKSNVTFPTSPAGLTVSYQTLDFKPVEGEGFCFECVNGSASDEELKTQMVEQLAMDAESIKVRKEAVYDVRAVRVNDSKTLTFYVPFAWEGYHMMVVGNSANATEVDNFIIDVRL